MPSRRHRPRRLLLPTVLAAVLAAEITGIALARSLTPAAVAVTVPPPVAAPAAAAPPALGAGSLLRVADPSEADSAAGAGSQNGLSSATVAQRGTSAAAKARQAARPAQASSRVTRSSSTRTTTGSTRTTTGSTRTPATSYHGANHVWIPSLGINKGVQSFPCSRSRPPDAGVYRWGCAGHNNIYLLSHAWSTFKPLHDAYVGGRLHTGLKVVYADGGGHVHTYSVIWWRVVAPTTAASWAWAALSRPGMTLQTCVGANSAYRLMVRLTRVA